MAAGACPRPWRLALALLLAQASLTLAQTLCTDMACSRCGKGRLCTQCDRGYYMDSEGFCMPCDDPYCWQCAGPGTKRCTRCPIDDDMGNERTLFYLQGGTCKPCNASPETCAQCGGDGRCSSCLPGFYLDSSKACRRCKDPLCKRCTPGGKCLQCQSHWRDNPVSDTADGPVYKDAQGVCRKCLNNPRDSGRDKCDMHGRCVRCTINLISGPVALDSRTGKCVACRDKLCARCDPTNPGKCLACQAFPYYDDYHMYTGPVYMAPNKTCVECTKHLQSNGCSKCSARGECIACSQLQESNGFVNRGMCTPCKARYARCSSCGQHGRKCTSCEHGYGLKGTTVTCLPCRGALCQDCSQFDRCTQCKEGAYLHPSEGRCIKYPKGCVQPYVDGSGRCRTCTSEGYRLGAGSRCVKAQDAQRPGIKCSDRRRCTDITTCNAQQMCTNCSAALIPDARGVTKDCQSYCTDPLCTRCPNHPSMCEECMTAVGEWPQLAIFRDAAGRCRTCPKGCADCSRNGTVCGTCWAGYSKIGKLCTACSDPRCLFCDGSRDRCTECYSGDEPVYLSSRGTCERAATWGCARYARDGRCLECEYGWRLVGGKCLA